MLNDQPQCRQCFCIAAVLEWQSADVRLCVQKRSISDDVSNTPRVRLRHFNEHARFSIGAFDLYLGGIVLRREPAHDFDLIVYG